MNNEGKSFDELLGVAATSEGEEGLAEVLAALQDGEAHTIGTLHMALQDEGLDLSGCQIAACVVHLHDLQGYAIKPLGPFDSFGSPQRFKLEELAKGVFAKTLTVDGYQVLVQSTTNDEGEPSIGISALCGIGHSALGMGFSDDDEGYEKRDRYFAKVLAGEHGLVEQGARCVWEKVGYPEAEA